MLARAKTFPTGLIQVKSAGLRLRLGQPIVTQKCFVESPRIFRCLAASGSRLLLCGDNDGGRIDGSKKAS